MFVRADVRENGELLKWFVLVVLAIVVSGIALAVIYREQLNAVALEDWVKDAGVVFVIEIIDIDHHTAHTLAVPGHRLRVHLSAALLAGRDRADLPAHRAYPSAPTHFPLRAALREETFQQNRSDA